MGIQKIGHQNLTCIKIAYSNGKSKEMEDTPVSAADLVDDLDDCELTELGCELGMVEGQLYSIPYELYDLPDLREILSLDTWNSCLTEEERFHLSAYLPDMDQHTFWLTMKELFDGSNIYFGNPSEMFFKRLKGGFYPPKVACFREGLQYLQRKKYYHSLRSYHDKMMQMFTDMRRIWDQCEMSSGIEERISLWTKRKKRRGINLLDLNKFPLDEHPLSEEANFDKKGMKSVESKRVKDISPSKYVNGLNFVAPNSRSKGFLKTKASGTSSFQNPYPEIVTSDILEQRRSAPKGVLKIVPKVPSDPLFSARTRGMQNSRFSSAPAHLNFQKAGILYESPFLRQKLDNSRVQSALGQPQCLLKQQESFIGKTKGEMVPSLDNISSLGKQKLVGVDEGMEPDKEHELLMDPGVASRYPFDGENLWLQAKDFSLRSLESYPFGIQFHGRQQHMPSLKEHLTCPRITEVVPRILGNGSNDKQETLMTSSDWMKDEIGSSARKSEKLLSKSNVSEGLKDEPALPLTYKRRKALAKVNLLDFEKRVITESNLKLARQQESNEHLRELAKAVKIKFKGRNDAP